MRLDVGRLARVSDIQRDFFLFPLPGIAPTAVAIDEEVYLELVQRDLILQELGSAVVSPGDPEEVLQAFSALYRPDEPPELATLFATVTSHDAYNPALAHPSQFPWVSATYEQIPDGCVAVYICASERQDDLLNARRRAPLATHSFTGVIQSEHGVRDPYAAWRVYRDMIEGRGGDILTTPH